MNEALTWIIANKEAVVGIIAGTLTTLALVAKLTPTPVDDGIIAKLLGWLNLVPRTRAK